MSLIPRAATMISWLRARTTSSLRHTRVRCSAASAHSFADLFSRFWRTAFRTRASRHTHASPLPVACASFVAVTQIEREEEGGRRNSRANSYGIFCALPGELTTTPVRFTRALLHAFHSARCYRTTLTASRMAAYSALHTRTPQTLRVCTLRFLDALPLASHRALLLRTAYACARARTRVVLAASHPLLSAAGRKELSLASCALGGALCARALRATIRTCVQHLALARLHACLHHATHAYWFSSHVLPRLDHVSSASAYRLSRVAASFPADPCTIHTSWESCSRFWILSTFFLCWTVFSFAPAYLQPRFSCLYHLPRLLRFTSGFLRLRTAFYLSPTLLSLPHRILLPSTVRATSRA